MQRLLAGAEAAVEAEGYLGQFPVRLDLADAVGLELIIVRQAVNGDAPVADILALDERVHGHVVVARACLDGVGAL